MLIVCPTPIGNLDDATPRQRQALADADVVACEDTRRTGKLLEHFGIDRSDGSPELVRYEEHNEDEAADELLDKLRLGADVALVSDAGTPGVSDPGYVLVRRAAEAGVRIVSLPGPVAAIVALAASGLPTSDFQFRGFPPSSAGKRRRFLEEIDDPDLTTILYESPRRIEALLEQMSDVYGPDRRVCLGRELTKRYEEYLRGTVEEVGDELNDRDEVKGECTLVVPPAPEATPDEAVVGAKIRELLDRGMRPRGVKEVVDELYDVPRSSLYDRIERLRGEESQ